MYKINSLKFLLYFSPLFLNCYYLTLSRHDGIFMQYDAAQYSRVKERTYTFFISKPRVANLIKAPDKDSVLVQLHNPKNWDRQRKMDWFINAHVKNERAIKDFTKYKFYIADTTILDIDEIERIAFKNSGLGQIKFKIKKNGLTQLIAKRKNKYIKADLEVKDSIVYKSNLQENMWKETIVGPIWF